MGQITYLNGGSRKALAQINNTPHPYDKLAEARISDKVIIGLPILVLIEICEISVQGYSENTFICMFVPKNITKIEFFLIYGYWLGYKQVIYSASACVS